MSTAAATAAAAAMRRSLLLGCSSRSSGRRVLPPLHLLPQQRHHRLHNEAANGADIDVRGQLLVERGGEELEGGVREVDRQIGMLTFYFHHPCSPSS